MFILVKLEHSRAPHFGSQTGGGTHLPHPKIYLLTPRREF
jgi:hypothetical protein